MARLKPIAGFNFEKMTEAFPYQREAIDALQNLTYAALFFEQGLGKTKIAIDLTLNWLRADVVDTVIVVTKKGLVRNWLREFQIHSNVTPRVISSDRSANHRALFSPSRVYVANYEAIASEEEKIRTLANHRRLAVILDESQKIKNPDSKLTQAFFRVADAFKRRLILTGTPMANRPYDIWAQIFFLDQGAALGKDFSKFRSSLDIPPSGAKSDYKDELVSVFPKIARFALRQTKAGSGLELPGKVYQMEGAEWEPVQREMYEKVRTELQIELLRNGVYQIDSVESLLKRLLRLVQIASNPRVIDEAYGNTPGKLPTLDRLVEKAVLGGEKLIVWTSFVDNCRILKDHLNMYGAVQVHGRMSTEDRDRSVQRFMNDDHARVLIATPAAAKEGLTLTVANHVVFYDRSFSLDDYVQAQDRIHRISQTKTCFVYNIILPGSIDEWVEALIQMKGAAATIGMGDPLPDELEGALEMDIQALLREVLND